MTTRRTTERWKVRVFHVGARVDTSPPFRTKDDALAWARKRPVFFDIELWCRPAGSSRYRVTTFGWSGEKAC